MAFALHLGLEMSVAGGNKSSQTQPTTSLGVERRGDNILVVTLKGQWLARPGIPGLAAIEQNLAQEPRPQAVEFASAELGAWDSALVSFLFRCAELCRQLHMEFRAETLPGGIQRLLHLAQADSSAVEATTGPLRLTSLARVGQRAVQAEAGIIQAMTFLGEVALAAAKLLRGRAQFRCSDAVLTMQECGPEALTVVALINFLVGLIVAFVGAMELNRFGASIYVADLVAIVAVREMGCLMTGIILSGRTGAAFAAQLGTMKVNEEIDALKTSGISAIEFLVLPRITALVLMMPLLCVFADAIAIAGGFVVSVSMLHMGPAEYFSRTIQAITVQSFLLGIFKGGVFGVLVAITGCLRGMQSGHSAAAVGQAATSAVVTGITSIIAADGVFAVICNALRI
jgi:phospholipid/cholesterol/gamma-HCH transport system permease protein